MPSNKAKKVECFIKNLDAVGDGFYDEFQKECPNFNLSKSKSHDSLTPPDPGLIRTAEFFSDDENTIDWDAPVRRNLSENRSTFSLKH